MSCADRQRPGRRRQFAAQGALFLDRDGVINVDRGYVHRVGEFEFVQGIFDLTRYWTIEVRRPIVVVSNQSGIGRGYFDERAYRDLMRWMCRRFAAEGSAIARVYHCSSHPQHGVGPHRREDPWRKPGPGMILEAAADLELDLACSVIVGDKASDMEAGARAGVGIRILVGDHEGEAPAGAAGYQTATDLAHVLALLRRHQAAEG